MFVGPSQALFQHSPRPCDHKEILPGEKERSNGQKVRNRMLKDLILAAVWGDSHGLDIVAPPEAIVEAHSLGAARRVTYRS